MTSRRRRAFVRWTSVVMLAAFALTSPVLLRATDDPDQPRSRTLHRYRIADLEQMERPPWWERMERPVLLVLSFGLIAVFPAAHVHAGLATENVSIQINGRKG